MSLKIETNIIILLVSIYRHNHFSLLKCCLLTSAFSSVNNPSRYNRLIKWLMRHELVKLYRASSFAVPFDFAFSSLLALQMKREEFFKEAGEGGDGDGSKKEHFVSISVALKPLILFLNALGFHQKKDGKNKILALIHSTSFLIGVLLAGIFMFYLENNIDYYSTDEGAKNVVVTTISYINCTCIYLTLIIISLKNIFASKERSLWRIFKCFDNIDVVLQTSFSIKCSKDSRMFYTMLLLLLLFIISASAAIIVEVQHFNLNNKFNAGRCIYAMMVYILSVEISLYCMLVNSIKARFCPLCKYLREENKSGEDDNDNDGSKSSHVEIEPTTIKPKLIVTESVRQVVSRLEEEISLIYDEILEIISLLNESFSTLLSSAFSEYILTASRKEWLC